MFGIGMPELMVILVVALVVLGPRRLPELARTLGKAMAEFRRQTTEIMDEFHGRALDEKPRRPASSHTAAQKDGPESARTPEKPDADRASS